MWLTSRSGSFFSWQNRCPTRTWWGITAKKFRSQSIDWQKEDKLFENQQLLRTPIVRNGRKATVGYQPDVWKDWE